MDKEIQDLRKDMAALEDAFEKKVAILRRRLNAIEMKNIWESGGDAKVADTPVTTNSSSTANTLSSEKLENNKQTEPAVATSSSSLPAAYQPPLAQSEEQHEGWSVDQSVDRLPKEQSVIARMVKEGLLSLFAPIFGPFARSLEQFAKIYHHYRGQGKAPVFFMTATGIVALVLSFGYQLQYSFNEYLDPPGKVALGFAVAFITTVGGVLFTRRRGDMAEYGSGLIALGVILNYLCAYFAGPYYGLVPTLLGFVILAAVTAAAYILALLFETRIVAVVTLVGGTTLPLVMDHVDQSPQLYLSYLLLLAIAMLRLSQRMRWQPLALMCMALCIAMIELSIGANTLGKQSTLLTENLAIIVIVHGFFYAFAHYALRGLSATVVMDRIRLMIVTSNVIFILFVTQELIQDSQVLGTLYLLNALPWIAVFLLPNKIFNYSSLSDEARTVQAIAILQAGLLIGAGILVLSSPEMRGIIWCLEGLMLIYLGGKFQLTSVRVEGYIALLVSIMAVGSQVIQWVINAMVPTVELLALNLDTGWGNLLAITALTYAAVLLMQRQRETLTDTECRLIAILDNLSSVLLSASFLLTIGIFWPQGMWQLAVVPLFFLIWRARCSQRSRSKKLPFFRAEYLWASCTSGGFYLLMVDRRIL